MNLISVEILRQSKCGFKNFIEQTLLRNKLVRRNCDSFSLMFNFGDGNNDKNLVDVTSRLIVFTVKIR